MTVEEELPFISHLPTTYGNVLLYFHTFSGLPVDQLNLVCLLFFQAFLGSLYRRITNTFGRHLFGMLSGLLMIWSLYGTYLAFLLILYISIFYPIVSLKSPKLTFWLSMLSLCSTFAYVTYNYYLSWRLDPTTSMMGIVVRLHTLTWDLVDGDKIKRKQPLGTRPRDIKFRQDHGCIRPLNFFEYFSYMLFFVHVLCGSNLTINEFLQISDRSIFVKNGWHDPNNDPSPHWYQVIKGIFEILFTAGLFLIGKIFFPLCGYCENEEFYNKPFWTYRWYMVTIAVFFTKFKYHFGWKCLDLSCLTSGCAFSGVKYIENKNNKNSKSKQIKKIYWNRARNINSITTALPNHTSDIVRNWNMTVNDWLTQYVFARAKPGKWLRNLMGGDFGAKVVITRLTSALFHGVYPGFYIFFFFTKFATDMLDSIKLILPTYEDYVENGEKYSIKAIFWWFFWLCMVLIPVDTWGTFFICLELQKTIDLFHHIYWFPVIFTIIGLIVAQILKKTLGIKKSEKLKREAKKKAKLLAQQKKNDNDKNNTKKTN